MKNATQEPSRLSPGDCLILGALSLALLGLGGLHLARTRGLTAPTPEFQRTEIVPSHLVDINTAEWWELQALRGIGEKKAKAIVEYRQQKDGFNSVDELVEVRGIGPKTLEPMRPFLTVQTRDPWDGKER